MGLLSDLYQQSQISGHQERAEVLEQRRWPHRLVGENTTRSTRIVAVTLGLALLGATAGALASWLAHVVSFLAVAGHRPWSMLSGVLLNPGFILLVLGQGAKVGVALGPVVGWALLRRVPLGWAGVGLAVGAFVGGRAGDWLVSRLFHGTNTAGWFPGMWGAAVGVLLAAAVLRALFRPRPDARESGASAGGAALPRTPPPERPAPVRPARPGARASRV